MHFTLRTAPLIVLVAGVSPGLAIAQDGWDSDGEEQDKRMKQVAESIEEMLGFFVVKPDKRDALETVVVDGTAAEIWYLHPMSKGTVVAARCDAYKWLFFGRLHRARGVRAVFERFSFLEEIKVVFFDVRTRIEPDGRRGYRQFRKTSPRLEITLTRATAMALNYDVLRSRMTGTRCSLEGERVVDRKWYRE